MTLTYLTLVGTFTDPTGAPAQGQLTFTPNAALTDASGNAVQPAIPVTAMLVNGQLSVQLLPCDTSGISPTGWSYAVTETTYGSRPGIGYSTPATRTYAVQPKGTGTVNIADLIPVNPVPPVIQYLPITGGTVTGPVSLTGSPPLTIPGAAQSGYVWTASDSGGDGAWQPPTGPSIPITIPEGGTGQQSQQAAINALVGGSPTAGTFLRGNGTNALMSTIQASDLPSQGWQFTVTAAPYSATGNVKVVYDGAMTSASAVLASATANFVSADVGKAAIVKGAATQATGTSLVSTIASVQSTTQVTLNNSASATVTGAQVVYGTDDTAAVQSAINAAFAYASANNGYAEVVFPPRWYMIAGPLVTGGTTLGNAQLTLPANGTPATQNPAPPKITLAFLGTQNAAAVRYWDQQQPAFNASALVSAGVFTSSANQVTSINNNGNPAVLGGPTGKGGYGTSGQVFSNMMLSIRGLSILTTHSQNAFTYGALHAGGLANCNLENFSYGTLGTVFAGDFTGSAFGTGLSIGVFMPANGNNDNCYCSNVFCQGGYTYGFFATEHTVITGGIIDCWAGLVLVGVYNDGSGVSGIGAVHAVSAPQLSIENCTNHLYIYGEGSGGVGPYIHGVLDTEGTPQIADRNSGLTTARGTLYITGSGGTLNVSDGTTLSIVYDRFQQPGPVSGTTSITPGTPVMNTYWRSALVLLTGGSAVTGVSVSNLAGGPSAPAVTSVYTQGSGALPAAGLPVLVGPGQWISVTGSGSTVSAQWMLS
jgi:hypothetical protein